ncbi:MULTISPECIES: hypothetical protein [unclassified Streptomyces]|uniref:hypothetical protein n=1 Tax=unclassified Streptomyces TaxID=2593676 RepID=UPI003626A3EE
MTQTERFVTLSAVLTGFDAAELTATGMTGIYQAFVARRVEPALYARLVDALVDTEADTGAVTDPRTVADKDEELGELARAVCHLWYLGTWPGEWPDDGRTAPAPPPARAYARGLVWSSFGGHAPGAGRPGYGTWAERPAGAAGGGER